MNGHMSYLIEGEMKTSDERVLRIARRMRPNRVLVIVGVLLLGGVLISVMGIAMDRDRRNLSEWSCYS